MASLGTLAAGSITAEQFVDLDSSRRRMAESAVEVDSAAVADLRRRGCPRDGADHEAFDATGSVAAAIGCRRRRRRVVREGRRSAQRRPATLRRPRMGGELPVDDRASLCVKETTGRASDLVAAVRSYSQLDRAESLQLTDIAEGIDSTLTMLAHRLRDRRHCRPRLRRRDVPRIQAIAGELNQVWTKCHQQSPSTQWAGVGG